MSEFIPFTSYSQAWSYIHEDPAMQSAARAWFASMFPEGHKTSLRPYLEMLSRHLRDQLGAPSIPGARGNGCVFHPRAVEFLLLHGRDYVPDTSQLEFYRTYPDQPGLGMCFSNTWQWMTLINEERKDELRLSYVEGLVWGYFGDPVLHAWNGIGLADERAFDWSHYPWCEWNRYFGFALTQGEYGELQQLLFPQNPDVVFSLFDLEYFPLVEERLYELLAVREPPA